MRGARVGSALVVALGIACGGDGGPSGPTGPSLSMSILSGDLQVQAAGTPLQQPLVVRVVDGAGHPVSSQLVNFRVVGGTGTMFAGSGQTDAAGTVQDRWTLGPEVNDTQKVEARAVDPTTGQPIVFATFRAYAAGQGFSPAAGFWDTADLGTPIADSLVVFLMDPAGLPVSGAAVTWTVTTGSGTASPGTSLTDAQGRAAAQFVAGGVQGPDTITATTAGHTSIKFPEMSAKPFFASKIGATCALAAGGQAYCWGYNSGVSGMGAVTIPTAIAAGVAFADIESGGPRCGLSVSGAIYCWGNFPFGGSVIPSPPPGLDFSVPNVVTGAGTTNSAVTVGISVACVIGSAGQARCWGGNWHGEAGSGASTAVNDPTPVAGGLLLQSISAGWDHTCGVTTLGIAYCWGSDTLGALGDGGPPGTQYQPVLVAGGLTFSALAQGGTAMHTCALTSAGQAYCWGNNQFGQLGDGTQDNRTTPTAVTGGLVFMKLGVDEGHSCGLATDHRVYCWGIFSLLGVGPSGPTVIAVPTPVTGGLTFTDLAVGTGSTCALATGGRVYCWGANDVGQLATGFQFQPVGPAKVLAP